MPSGLLTTTLDTIAQGVADAVAALHDGAFATFKFIGRLFRFTVELPGETVAYII